MIERNALFRAIGAAIAVVFTTFALVLFSFALLTGAETLHAAGAILTSAAVGFDLWMLRLFADLRLHRRKNTMDFLVAQRANTIFEAHKSLLRDRIGLVPEIDADLARRLREARSHPTASEAERHDAETAQSLTYVLNLYEFVCAAVAYKNFDNEFVYATLGPQIVGVYKRYRPYMELSSTRLAYLYLREIATRWDESPPRIRWQDRAAAR